MPRARKRGRRTDRESRSHRDPAALARGARGWRARPPVASHAQRCTERGAHALGDGAKPERARRIRRPRPHRVSAFSRCATAAAPAAAGHSPGIIMSVLFTALSVGVAAAALDRPDRSAALRLRRWSSPRRIKSALRLTAVNDAAARSACDRHGARRCARDVSAARGRGCGRHCRRGNCSKRSPTGATATRRWSGSIRRTA